MFSLFLNSDEAKSSHSAILPDLAVEPDDIKSSRYCLNFPFGIEVVCGVVWSELLFHDQLILVVKHLNAVEGLFVRIVEYFYAHLPDCHLRQIREAAVLAVVAVPLVVDAPEPVGQFQAHSRDGSFWALLLEADGLQLDLAACGHLCEMAHLWALKVVVLAGLCDAPLSEALEFVEFCQGLDTLCFLEERPHGWREERLVALQVRGLQYGRGAQGRVVRHHFVFRQRSVGFEFLVVFGRLQLIDFLAQHRLGLERVLLNVCDQLFLLVDDLLELLHPFVVALLLMSPIIVAVVNRLDVRVDFLNLIERYSSFKG